jgi:predicted TIM-barrel fold metal-dependent hydrolase
MPDVQLSRREAVFALAGGLLSAGVSQSAPAESDSIIDTHFHLVESRLPGVFDDPALPSLPPFGKDDQKLDKYVKLIEDEAKKSKMTTALCMPRCEISDKDPLGIRDTLAVIKHIRGPRLYPIGLAHPERFDRDHLARVEEVFKEGKVKALKAYLGYFQYEPYSPGYRKYFNLASKYKIPVIFHCGDTYSKNAKVKYAHPLKIDEVAVDYPDTRFVIAHFGNPWLMDAAQVAYRNENVWIDLSAILIGEAFTKKKAELKKDITRIKQAVAYVENPGKFLFGSDWPLTPVSVYADFIRQVFPKNEHAAVFRKNAENLFGL